MTLPTYLRLRTETGFGVPRCCPLSAPGVARGALTEVVHVDGTQITAESEGVVFMQLPGRRMAVRGVLLSETRASFLARSAAPAGGLAVADEDDGDEGFLLEDEDEDA